VTAREKYQRKALAVVRTADENMANEIRLIAVRGNGEAQISVSDQGIGIPAGMEAKLFTLGDEAKRAGTAGESSFGLGLALVAAIVDLHGATVAIVDERPGTRIEMRFA